MTKYFGTDGIRGIAGEFLTKELAERVGMSLKRLKKRKVIVGMDTRESGPMLAKGILDGAQKAGINTIEAGIVPTPLLAHLSKRIGCLGVMITASHNPFHDNGIKLFVYGKKLFLDEETLLEECLNGIVAIEPAYHPGTDLPAIDPMAYYLPLFANLLQKTELKIVIDTANGATYQTAKAIFTQITDHLIVIGDQPNGQNINLGVGSTHLELLRETVLKTGSDVGFAFDGDGDRVLAIDHLGRIVDGDLLIYLCAMMLKSQGKLPNNTIVLTKMSNLGLIQALKKHGIDVEITDVGDKYVVDAMDHQGLFLGGENSGHIINKTLLETGDGVLNAAYIVSIMSQSSKSLAELVSTVTLFPDRLHNLKNIDRELAKHPRVLKMVEEVTQILGENGKVLVRASGTEPLIRISVSAQTEELVELYINKFIALFDELRKG